MSKKMECLEKLDKRIDESQNPDFVQHERILEEYFVCLSGILLVFMMLFIIMSYLIPVLSYVLDLFFIYVHCTTEVTRYFTFVLFQVLDRFLYCI